MTEMQAAMIQTWQDEPALLREPGVPDPVFTCAEIEQARIVCATIERHYGTTH